MRYPLTRSVLIAHPLTNAPASPLNMMIMSTIISPPLLTIKKISKPVYAITGNQVVFKIMFKMNPIPKKSTKNSGTDTINWGRLTVIASARQIIFPFVLFPISVQKKRTPVNSLPTQP